MTKCTWIVASCISISDPKKETVTRDMSYKFILLNQSIIRPLWEIKHNYVLNHPNQFKPMSVERRFRGLLQDQISDIEDPKSQR